MSADPRIPFTDFNILVDAIKGEDPDVTLSPEFAQALLGEIERLELHWCDHSVGIFHCSTADAYTDLKLATEGKRPCIECGMDGFIVHGEQDEERYERCPKCQGKGVVELEAVS